MENILILKRLILKNKEVVLYEKNEENNGIIACCNTYGADYR